MLRQRPFADMLVLVGGVLPALAGAIVGQPASRPPALQVAFVGGADNVLELRGGTFTAIPNATPTVSSIVTVGGKNALVLESQKPLTGPGR